MTNNFPWVEIHFECGIEAGICLALLQSAGVECAKSGKCIRLSIEPLSERKLVDSLSEIGIKTQTIASIAR